MLCSFFITAFFTNEQYVWKFNLKSRLISISLNSWTTSTEIPLTEIEDGFSLFCW